MKLIASNDGIIWTTVLLNSRRVFPNDRPASRAATTAAMKMTVPGIAMKFRFTVASSGVGIGATGGIFSTALCRYGIGTRKALKFTYRASAGRPLRKIKMDAMMNGDQPFNTS